MEGSILLSSSENTRQVEEEEKSRFVRSILEEIGLPMEDIWEEDNSMTLDNKIKLRHILATYNIQIVDEMGANLQIYSEKQIIAEWKKPFYVLKKDNNEVDPRKKLYLEMQYSYWSIFEET